MTFRKFFFLFPLCLFGQTQMDYVKQIKNKPAIDVREYGAKGDGVADDTNAFKNALTSCSVTGCTIEVPVGTYNISDTLVITDKISIRGVSNNPLTDYTGSVQIEFKATNKPLFSIVGDKTSIANMTLKQSGGTATSGSVGILARAGFGGANAVDFFISNVSIFFFYNGIIIDGSLDGELRSVLVKFSESDGIIGRAAQGNWTYVNTITNKGNGFKFEAGTVNTGVPPFMLSCNTFANGGWGIYSTAGLSQLIDFFINNDSLGGIYLNSLISQLDSGLISGGNIQYTGINPIAGNPGFTNNSTAPGIKIDSGSFNIRQVNFFNCNGICIESNYTRTMFSGIRIQGAGIGGVAGNLYAVKINADSNIFSNSNIIGPVYFNGNYGILSNNYIVYAGTALPTVQIAGGTEIVLSSNNIANFGGVTSALQIDSGATISHNANEVVGTFVNNGSLALYSNQLTPIPLLIKTLATLGGNSGKVAMVWCSDCVANNNACSGSGTGALAVWNAGSGVWICK